MTVCVMLSNGFLNTLDLRISEQPCHWLQSGSANSKIMRAVCQQDGRWRLLLANGEWAHANLQSYWVLPAGCLIGLSWRLAGNSKASCLTSLHWQHSATIRRLLAKLRYPLPPDD